MNLSLGEGYGVVQKAWWRHVSWFATRLNLHSDCDLLKRTIPSGGRSQLPSMPQLRTEGPIGLKGRQAGRWQPPSCGVAGTGFWARDAQLRWVPLMAEYALAWQGPYPSLRGMSGASSAFTFTLR